MTSVNCTAVEEPSYVPDASTIRPIEIMRDKKPQTLKGKADAASG